MRHNRHSSWIYKSISIACVLVLTCLSTGLSPVSAETPADAWTLVSQFGGSTQAVAVSDETAFAGIGLSLTAVDISDPTKPIMLGKSAPFADTVQDIFIQGKTAYVAAGSAGLQIVDISDPAKLKLLGSWQSPAFTEGIAVAGKTAFLANGAKGVSIIDISDPSKPKQIASAYTEKYAFDVVCAGNNAYIAAGDAGLLILDIKDPTQPKELAQLDTDGYAYEVVQSDKYIYIADAWAGVQVIDITDPAKPVLTTSIATGGWSLGVGLSDNHLVSANGGQGFDLFDVKNPTKPVLKSTFYKQPSEGDATPRRVAIMDDLLLVADTTNGLRLVDISVSIQLKQKGIFSQLGYARRLTIDGDYAYVATANEGSMEVLNISDPLQPYQVSKFQADGVAADIMVTGKYATLGTFQDSTNCYSLIDISKPDDPQVSSVVDLQSLICGAPRQMAAQGDYVYSADEWGLSIYDISVPGEIKTAGRIELQQEGHQTVALSVSGNFAYVGDAGAGLKIVDVSNPADPKLVTVYKYGGNVGSVFSAGDILYLGHYGEGLTTVSNPKPGAMPTLLGKYKTLGSVEEVTASENMLVVSEGSGGLEILDATNPAKIQFIQAIKTSGFAWASVVKGDYIYTADGAAGVLIFKKGQPASSSKTPDYPLIVTNSISKGQESVEPVFMTNVEKVTSAATCMVNSNSDNGSGSLRECLTNADAGETILFDPKTFPPKAAATIALESPLPGLETGSITIDASNAGVILDGQQNVPVGLRIASSYNTIMGLQFVNFPMDGITLEYPGEYNQIGGDHATGDGPSGQGNVFSGCQNGIRALFTRNNTIKGNFVGTNAAGSQAAKPNSIGILLSGFATYNTIGGALEGEKNIISNNDRGVDLSANSSEFNTVAGNYVGTDITGTKAIPNISWGILVEVGGRNNIIGGTTPEARNIISGNAIGVCVSDYGSTQNSIIGNIIGLDVTGTKPLPNQNGSGIFQSAYNRIGGSLPGEGNLISANTGPGVRLFGMGSIQAMMMGNQLGMDITGKKTLANTIALNIDGGTHSFIGGSNENAANTFSGNQTSMIISYAGTSYNWLAGNLITASSQIAALIDSHADNNTFVNNTLTKNKAGFTILQSVGNTLHANSISGSSGLAIELREGGNLELAAPVIAEAIADKVTGTACPGCVVELFSDPANQGLVYEGMTLADASGSFTFTGKVSGPNVTTTATDLAGNTSAFSKTVKVK